MHSTQTEWELPTSDPVRIVHPLLRARDWQDRPELKDLCEWWKTGGTGVCSLVGMGGAGKTAIADRFLLQLPGGYPQHPHVGKSSTLPPAQRLMVFSFYHAPNTDSFFREICDWLSPGRNTSADHAQPYAYNEVISLLSRAGRCLIVLDGLEKVQDDGLHNAFGHIADANLRRMVLDVADCYLPNVSFLITSRFRLYDPIADRSSCYRQIDIQSISEDAAIRLLRRRGVSRGTDSQLGRFAAKFGNHALTLDLLGGYIARFHNGDPSTIPSLGELCIDQLDPNLSPSDQVIKRQEHRFSKVATFYRDALGKSDPATLAILERLSIFQYGISESEFKAIFVGPDKERISTEPLASLQDDEFPSKLQLLNEMRLVEAPEDGAPGAGDCVYTVHPAVRDAFSSGLDDEMSMEVHEAARKGLETSLGKRPANKPSSPVVLDKLEEVIFHSIKARKFEAAAQIYRGRMGGCLHLIHELNDYVRASRITSRILAEAPINQKRTKGDLHLSTRITLCNDLGFSSRQLGRLTTAERFLNLGLSLCDEVNKSSLRPLLFNQFQLQALRGYLSRASATIRKIMSLDLEEKHRWSAQANLVIIEGLQGRAAVSIGAAAAAASGLVTQTPSFEKYDRYLSVAAVIDSCLNDLAKLREHFPKGHYFIASNELRLAEHYLRANQLELANTHLNAARAWSIRHDCEELLCVAAGIDSQILMRQAASANDQVRASDLRQQCEISISAGVRIARECGFSLEHTDLLLLKAELSLWNGEPTDALRHIATAIDEGFKQSSNSMPNLLAANDPECGYVWAIARGLFLRGQALLLDAAQKLNQTRHETNLSELPLPVKTAIEQGRLALEASENQWRMIRDPDQDADIHPEGQVVREAIAALNRGDLTSFPLSRIADHTTTITAHTSTARNLKSRLPMAPPQCDVFVCYAHADNVDLDPKKRWLDRLLVFLHPFVKQDNLAIFSDKANRTSDDWHVKIQSHLNAASAAILLVSADFLASEYIRNNELPILLKNAVDHGLKLFPIIVAPCSFERATFKYPHPIDGPNIFQLSSIQAANSPRQTLADMTEAEQSRILRDVAEQISDLIRQKKSRD